MATNWSGITMNNCTFDETEKAFVPSVSNTLGQIFRIIVGEGLYTVSATSALSDMAQATDMDDLIDIFASRLAPYALFLEDMSGQIASLRTTHSLTTLIDILRSMFTASDMSSLITRLKNEYYQTASVVVTMPTLGVDAFDGTQCGNYIYIIAETDSDVTLETNLKYVPTNHTGSVTTLSSDCGIVKNHQFHGQWKEGYNKFVFYLTKPTVTEITSKATSMDVDKNTWFIKGLNYYLLLDSSSLSPTTYTLTFNTKISLVESAWGNATNIDSTSPGTLRNFLRYQTNYTVDQLFGTEGAVTGNDVNSLATSLSNVDAKLDNVSTTTTLELTESSYYNTDWTYYSQDYVPTLYRYGNVIQFTGAFKNTATVAAISSSSGAVTMCTIPTEYRPVSPVRVLCQGSELCHWLMTVNTDGTVTLQRYGYNNTAVQMATNRWLVFNATWIVGS